MDKIYIVDAVNVLFRSYYAIPKMTNARGESTNALYGFIRTIYKLMNDFSPEYLVATFDGPDNKRSRTEIYKEYKSHREGMPEDLVPQLIKAIEFCEIAGIPYLQIEGVEADDTMGTVAKWAEKKNSKAYLCSSDKDLCQLISPNVFMLQLHKENLLVDADKVKEIYGVTPEQIIDYLAIVGDTSDNIPGLRGLGPKAAEQLLNEYGTLEEVLANAAKLSGKKQQIVSEGKEIALMSKKLATIHLGIEIPKEEIFYRLKEPDVAKVQAFYQEMNFLSLLKNLEIQEEKKRDVVYTLVDDPQALFEQLKDEKEICIDTETTSLNFMSAKLVGIGLGVKPGVAWYVPAALIDPLRPLFGRASFYGHNIKYDYHILLNEGIKIKKISFDTMIGSYLLTPQNPRHGLDQLSLEKFGKVKTPITDLIGKGKNQISMEEVEIEKIKDYCCEDVDYTCRLKELEEKEIKEKKLTYTFESIELPLIPVLASMERRGIYVDTKKLQSLYDDFSVQIHHLEKDIYDLAGETFNINSPKQLSVILYEKLNIKAPRGSTSTSADILETLQDEYPIIQLILEYRGLEKLRSTYTQTLIEQVDPQTKRIHCTFNQSVAATGRLSCQDPNLQNIPIRSALGVKIREAFKPEHSDWSFLGADYSQIELRLLAHLSEDPELLKAFHENLDVHAYTASLVFNVPLNEVTSQMRQQAKAVNYGILYGQQAFGLSQSVGLKYHEATTFIEKYFERYKKVKEYLEFCKETVRKTGTAITLTGRQRPIPEIHSKNPFFRAMAERLAVNTPLQGSNADIIKLAMIELDSLGYMILQIHDELLFEVPDHEIHRVKPIIKNTMENIIKLKVPLVVDISIGKNWGEC